MAIFSCLLGLFVLIAILPLSTLASQIKGNVSVGQTLKAKPNGPTWLSPSGHFALGFHSLDTSNDQFLLAIWYAKIPDTVVWHANGGKPVSQGSTLTLTVDQGLLLSDPKGSLLWSTRDELKNSVVSHGFMNDTGNFVIKDIVDVDPIWQSFKHPTDTLLPTQTMERGTALYARRSETNFTQGKFQVIMQTDGNLVFYPSDIHARDFGTNGAYAATMTLDNTNQTNAGLRVVYEESGNMYLLRGNGLRFNLTADVAVPSSEGYYHRATLNFDGVLTWSYHLKSFAETTNVGWETIKTLPDNICSRFAGQSVSGTCGLNSICVIGDDKRPKCKCPSNFSLVDPNDTYGDCTPDFRLHDCDNHGQDESKYNLIQFEKTDWTQRSYAELQPATEDDCKSFCLNDCFCAVVVYSRSDSTCWKKQLPLVNGRQGEDVGTTVWIKVGNGNSSENYFNPINIKSGNKLNTVVAALLAGSVFVNICIFSVVASLIYCFIYRKKKLINHDRGDQNTLGEYANVTCFSYKALTEATNGFKEEIGRGAFGIVYKGVTKVLGGRSMFVAVKRIDRISKEADKEFKTEVNAIGQTHHKNLVRLVGFCKEDQQLLVYEYMSNGSLADFLFGDVKPNWFERIKIARGAARGLLYLHEECGTQIIHCDIKPQNILLDDYYNARISDFGLAKLLVLNQTQTQTGIRGTKGYVAPEWFRNKAITAKVDVYSFGVVLLEIICRRRNVCLEGMREEETILTDWALNCYQFGTVDYLVSNDIDAVNDKTQVEQFVMVALWCIQEDPSVRPTMRMVCHMLEGLVQVPQPPCFSSSSFSVSTQL